MTYRLRNIALAVGLALLAALLTTFYVANYKRHVQQGESETTVYVAKRDIPSGTPGSELLRKGWLSTQKSVQRNVVPGAISDPGQVSDLITREDIYSGEQVTLRRFANHAQQGVRAELRGTLRAVTIPGTPEQLLAGTLKDGDRVDVLANLKTGDCATCFASRLVARNILVLHAPSSTLTAKAQTPGTSTYTTMLAVSDRKEEQKIWFAVQNATGWSLVLRPVTNAVDSKEAVEGIYSMLKDGAAPSQADNYPGGNR